MAKRFVGNGPWALLCIVSIFLCITLVGAQSAKANPSPNALIKRQMSEYSSISSKSYSERVDMYICHFEDAGKVQQIHALRPDLICLLYRNMREVYQSSDEFQMFKSNNWLLKDAQGRYITALYGSNYLVDKGNAGYQQWVANWMKSYLDNYGFNGVFDDCNLYATIGENCWSTTWSAGITGPPINPRTNNPWTNEEHRAAEIALINRVKNTIGSRLVICNGIYEGTRFFGGYEDGNYADILLGSKLDGLMSEGLFSDQDSTNWYSENKWLDSVNFVVWLENNLLPGGKMFLSCCPNAQMENGPMLPPGCTKQQYASYCFASLLLGAKTIGAHYLNLALYTFEDYAQSLFSVDLGTPLGAYYMVQGTHVYARDFSNVKVLVNPTYETLSINLDGNYETLEGVPVPSPLTLYPHTGMILKRLTVASALAHVYIEHPYRGDLIVDIGVGDPANPVGTLRIWDGGGGSAQNLDLTVDVSAGLAYLPPSETNRWFLKVYDRNAGNEGQVVEFTLTYQGQTSSSPDVPKPIRDYQTTIAYISSVREPTSTYFDFAPNPIAPSSNVVAKGILVNKLSKPIAYADVNVEYSTNDGLTWNHVWTLTTDGLGMFSKAFSAPDVGRYLVRVSYAGDSTHAPSSNNAYLMVRSNPYGGKAAGSIFFNFLPSLAPPSTEVTLKGILLDGSGQPIASAAVTIMYSTDDGATGHYIWALTTDQYGIFSNTFRAPEGTYLVQASYGSSKITAYVQIQP